MRKKVFYAFATIIIVIFQVSCSNRYSEYLQCLGKFPNYKRALNLTPTEQNPIPCNMNSEYISTSTTQLYVFSDPKPQSISEVRSGAVTLTYDNYFLQVRPYFNTTDVPMFMNPINHCGLEERYKKYIELSGWDLFRASMSAHFCDEEEIRNMSKEEYNKTLLYSIIKIYELQKVSQVYLYDSEDRQAAILMKPVMFPDNQLDSYDILLEIYFKEYQKALFVDCFPHPSKTGLSNQITTKTMLTSLSCIYSTVNINN